MKKKNTSVIQKISLFAGIGLFMLAVILLIAWQWGIRVSQQKTEEYVRIISAILPNPQGAVPEEKQDNTMPILSVDGTDFVGLLEMPRFGAVLPVGAQWEQLLQYPQRFSGSIYDATMQIGGTTQKGQYDFYQEISVADTVVFTDMQGNRYTYQVTHIHYAKHADQAALQREDAALTVFIKNIYGLEYIILFCDVAGVNG